MGIMATVTFFLNDVAALTEGGADLLRNGEIFPMGAHAIPAYRVTAFPKLLYRLGMAFPAFFRKDHGLLVRSSLMVDVAGHTVDALLGMLRFYP
jgi:hypothetical protein